MKPQSAKKLKRGTLLLLTSGAIALVGTIGFLASSPVFQRSSGSVEVRLVKAELGEVEDTISESGTILLGNQQTLKSPADGGVVEQVSVRVGDRATRGTVLIILQNPNRETALTKKQLAIQQQDLKLASSRTKVTEATEKLKSAQNNLETATANEEILIRQQALQLTRDREKVAEANTRIALLEAELQRLEAALEKGFIPANEVRDRKNQIIEARSQLRDEEIAVQRTTLELQRSQKQLRLKQTEQSQTVLEARANLQQAQLDVSSALRERENLKLDLRTAERELQKSAIAATADGTVIDIKVKPGDVVKLGDPLLTLGDRRQQQVIVDLNPLDAVRVKPNQDVRVSTIGPQAEELTGKVRKIAQIAAPANQDDQRGQNSVRATIELDKPGQTLIPGSQASVEIIVAQRQQVVTLNTEMIQRDGETAFVWLGGAGNKAEKRPVTLGLEGLSTVEIKSGLKPGDRVILVTPDLELQSGMPIIPQASETETNDEN